MLSRLKNMLKTRSTYDDLKKIPIFNWWEITDKGNLDFIVIKGEYSEQEKYNAYLILLQQYYDYFGMGDDYKNFLQAKLNYAIKVCEHNETQNGVTEMFMKMAEVDLKEVTPVPSKEESVQLHEIISDLEMNGSPEMDEHKTSAYKFYSRYNYQSEKIKRQNEALRRNVPS